MNYNTLSIGIVQHQVSISDPARHTRTNLSHQIKSLASQGAKLIILPELHDTPYFCQTEDVAHFSLAQPIPGPTTAYLSELAKQYQCVIVGSIFEKRAKGLYHNTAVVLDTNGEIAGIYRKMHIPDDPGFYEKYYFAPGDLGFRPIETSLGKLGVLICWDQWFPEAARAMTLQGADMLIYPTAIGWDPRDNDDEQQRQLQAWQLIQQSHAVANGIPVISVNRVGHEADLSNQTEGITFWGNSFIAGQQGELLAKGENNTPALLLADVDLSRTDNVRQTWPFLRDRRIDTYQTLQHLWLT